MRINATKRIVLQEWAFFVEYGKHESRARPDDYSSPGGGDLEDCELVTLVEKVDRCFGVFLDGRDRFAVRGALLDIHARGNVDRVIPPHVPHQQVKRFYEQLDPVVSWWDRILGLREEEELAKKQARMTG